MVLLQLSHCDCDMLVVTLEVPNQHLGNLHRVDPETLESWRAELLDVVVKSVVFPTDGTAVKSASSNVLNANAESERCTDSTLKNLNEM